MWTSEARQKEFWAIAKKNRWEKAAVGRLLEELGVAMVDQIPLAAWEAVKETISKPPVAG